MYDAVEKNISFFSALIIDLVLFLQINVAGLMYYWDLTIDVVSTIILVIGVGLSVDYASHVGHAYLVQTGSSNGNNISCKLL